ncbi:MAG: aldehyde dehydrogenase family protein, partial [Akkermansiaceae bacterium]|nr:aldehyde dehydrogenase family protein [Akkermansiaceae bacterium]
MTLQGTSIIGASRGQGSESAGQSSNPANNEALDPNYIAATDKELQHAVSLADDAFQTLRQTSGADKAKLLRTIAENIEASIENLVTRMPLETGLPEMRVRG